MIFVSVEGKIVLDEMACKRNAVQAKDAALMARPTSVPHPDRPPCGDVRSTACPDTSEIVIALAARALPGRAQSRRAGGPVA